MRPLFTLVLLLSLCGLTFAQNGVPPNAGARGMAMANASSTFQDINSIFSNQAGLAYLEKMAFTAGGERRFLLADINSYTAGFAVPTKGGTFGLSVNYYGFEGYNESKVGLAYAKKLFDNFAIGAQLDYFNTSIPEYGSKALFTFEIGMQAVLIERVTLAAHIFSPIQQEIITDENLPTILKLGIGYQASDKLFVTAEMEKDLDFDANVKLGIEYFLIDILSLRTGVSTNPLQNTFGLGLKLKSGLMVDIAAGYHHVLGITPAASITYQFQ